MRLVLLVAALACLVVSASASAELKLDYPGAYDDSAPAEKRGSGARVRAGGGQGGTAIHWMAFNGDEAGVSQAIISGAGVNERVKKGSTPLHLAAYNGHTAVARLLIEHGARVNARTEDGITPLDWAQRNGHREVAKLLLANGAKATNANQARSNGAPRADSQASTQNDPSSGVGSRAPLKYSLVQLPENIMVMDSGLKISERETVKPASAGIYRIHLGAFSSEKLAQDAWALYQKKYPESLGSRDLILDRINAKGESLYRVHTGPMIRSDAWGICAQLKQAGQSCAVMKRRSP
ncbi:MAG: ankyrin repeat domain-containing protein [Gammaproteobacteria bacterium]|jgi:hypothetical protein|nr:ankyrin repeat domain-containing protein [Gammaproteobacteria bacterium]